MRRKPLVILAEDTQDMRELIADALVDEGYDVVQVGDGVRLLEVLGAMGSDGPGHPDLVITDVRMPGLSGLDALAEVRRTDRFVPVLVITGFGDAAIHAQAHALGATVLNKPLAMEDLVAWTRQLAPPAPD